MTTIWSGIEHRRQPVGDDERGAAARQPVEGAADRRLALGVERRGRLVEQEDGRVAQDGAGDRQPLALAAGKLAGRGHDLGVVALRQRADEAVGGGGAGGRLDLLADGVLAAEADVARDAAREQHQLLADHRDLVAQRREGQRAQVAAVEQDAAGGRVVEPRQQVEERRLAGAGAADEGDAAAGLDDERDALEGGVAVGVDEGDVLEADLPEHAVDPLGAVADGVLDVEQREDAIERGAPLLDTGDAAAEAAGRAGDHPEAGEERGEVRDGDGAGLHTQPDDEEQDRDGDPDQHLHQRRDPGLHPDLGGAQAEQPLEDALGVLGERGLEPVGPRHADAGEALGDLGGHRRHLGLGVPARAGAAGGRCG